jgi:hypothetical protein
MRKRVAHLRSQQLLAQQSAAVATCREARLKHDDLARAYGKIIGVLERERLL